MFLSAIKSAVGAFSAFSVWEINHVGAQIMAYNLKHSSGKSFILCVEEIFYKVASAFCFASGKPIWQPLFHTASLEQSANK